MEGERWLLVVEEALGDLGHEVRVLVRVLVQERMAVVAEEELGERPWDAVVVDALAVVMALQPAPELGVPVLQAAGEHDGDSEGAEAAPRCRGAGGAVEAQVAEEAEEGQPGCVPSWVKEGDVMVK